VTSPGRRPLRYQHGFASLHRGVKGTLRDSDAADDPAPERFDRSSLSGGVYVSSLYAP